MVTILCKYLRKGSSVYLEGQLQTGLDQRPWDRAVQIKPLPHGPRRRKQSHRIKRVHIAASPVLVALVTELGAEIPIDMITNGLDPSAFDLIQRIAM